MVGQIMLKPCASLCELFYLFILGFILLTSKLPMVSQLVSELGPSLIVWVEAKQNDVMGPLTNSVSRKACAQM